MRSRILTDTIYCVYLEMIYCRSVERLTASDSLMFFTISEYSSCDNIWNIAHNNTETLNFLKKECTLFWWKYFDIRFFLILMNQNLFRAVTPRSKIYVCISNNKVFHAVFLKSSTKEALTYELCDIVGLNPRVVQEVFMEGPKNIHVIVSDSVVYHIKEESAFSVSVHKEKEQYVLILKQVKWNRLEKLKNISLLLEVPFLYSVFC